MSEDADTLRHLLTRYVTPGPPVVGDLAMALAALDALVAENERMRAEIGRLNTATQLDVLDLERRLEAAISRRRALAERVIEACAQLVLSNVSNTYVAERMAERLRALDLEPLLTPEGT